MASFDGAPISDEADEAEAEEVGLPSASHAPSPSPSHLP
jgi:hypothetical protein